MKRKNLILEAGRLQKLAGIKVITEDDKVLNTDEPTSLRQVTNKKDGADAVIGGGAEDGDKTDDVVAGKSAEIPVGKLKPAQQEIIVDKAVSFALGFVNTGEPDLNDMEAIVSNDNYIMDGHHRWAARFLIDPTAKVTVMAIDLPGGALVTALNVITVGKLGITAGNKGTGDVKEFTGDKIGKALDDAMQNGTTQWPKQNPEQVKEALGKIPGANGDATKGKEIMMKNADALPKQIMPGAPARVEMPVIDAKKVAMVQKMLAAGLIDVKPPYSSDVTSKYLNVDHVVKSINHQLFEAVLKRSIHELNKTIKRIK
jgi:hypothetical protein